MSNSELRFFLLFVVLAAIAIGGQYVPFLMDVLVGLTICAVVVLVAALIRSAANSIYGPREDPNPEKWYPGTGAHPKESRYAYDELPSCTVAPLGTYDDETGWNGKRGKWRRG